MFSEILSSQELAALFGTVWATDYLIPSIIEIRRHKSYLRRLTALQACAMMSAVVDADAARTEMLPIVLEMATDAVSEPNQCLDLMMLPHSPYVNALIHL